MELDLGAQTNESNKYKKVSDLDMYQKVALTTAIYPREQAIIYPTLGLTGEAGEVANKVKKIIRDGSDSKDEKLVSEIKSEIGDCLWYIAVLANDFDIKLSDIASANIEKLATRKSKGTIHGSGFTDRAKATQSINKIKGSGKTHAHKMQAAIAMSQRAKVASERAKDPEKKKDLASAHRVYQQYINQNKKKD